MDTLKQSCQVNEGSGSVWGNTILLRPTILLRIPPRLEIVQHSPMPSEAQ